MIESLLVLNTCRKTAILARRIVLQIIHSNIISAPDELREQVRTMARMQLTRTPEAWCREYRNVPNVYWIALKSLARRYLELHDEVADLDVMNAAIVDGLVPELIKRNVIGYVSASQLLITARDNPQRLRTESEFAALCGVIPISFGKTIRYRFNRGEIEPYTAHFTSSSSDAYELTQKTKEYVASA